VRTLWFHIDIIPHWGTRPVASTGCLGPQLAAKIPDRPIRNFSQTCDTISDNDRLGGDDLRMQWQQLIGNDCSRTIAIVVSASHALLSKRLDFWFSQGT
jgi:hypothetical protein